MAPEVTLTDLKAVEPISDGAALVVKAIAVVGDDRTELEIAITTDLAVGVAVAPLATTAKARALRDDLAPALDVLVAGVVASGHPGTARLQLLFNEGAILPPEMSVDAAKALRDALSEALATL